MFELQGFVRELSRGVVFDGEACWRRLKGRRGISVERCGDSIVCLIAEKAFYETVVEAITERDDFLCKGGYENGKRVT